MIIGLERALSAAKRLRDYYRQGMTIKPSDTPIFPEGLSVHKLMIEIAKLNGGKLVVKEATKIIVSNLHTDREHARNSIYSNLDHFKAEFLKIEKGIYQQR